jgi:hypothetical protein
VRAVSDERLGEIEALDPRIMRALLRAGYRTRAQVAQTEDATLLRLRWLGPRRVAQLRRLIPRAPASGG